MKKTLLSGLLGLCSLLMMAGCEDEAKEVTPTNSNPGSFTASVSSVDNTSATLKWTAAADEDGDDVTYTVKLNDTEVASGLSTLTYTLTNLTEGTAYTGTVIAEDGNGGSSQTSYSFTTNSPANSAPGAFTVTVSDISDTGAELSWTAATDADGDNVTYRIRLAGDQLATDLSATSYTLSGLTEETSYNGKVVAMDGNGGISEATFSFTTQSAPNTAPGSFTVTVSNVTDTGADLSWTAATDADGDNVTYKVISGGNEVATGLSSTSYSFSSLTAETSYDGKVVAEDGNGGVSEATWSFTTGATTTEVITLTFGATSSTTITIDSWTATAADGYVVVMNSSNSFSDLSNGTLPKASTTYEGYGEQVVYAGTNVAAFTVSLLQGSTDYFFKVFPYTGSYVYNNGQTATSSQADACTVTSNYESDVCFTYTNTDRSISSNQYPDHDFGSSTRPNPFPNADVTPTGITRNLTPDPQLAGSATYVYDETGGPKPSNPNFYQFGIATNGVEFHPMGLKPWTNPSTNEENWEWQAAVINEGDTDLDAYGGHVTSVGVYHYHGDVVGLANEEDGSRHSVLYGYAADGFPIYYKYGYTVKDVNTSAIKELMSSYRLKSGARTGTGTAGTDYPDGDYDGTYIQDYEYVSGLGDLDECNGRYGVTPEYPDGIYYYVITADFPKVPNCFMGTPDADWIIGN